jgi:hypothetical protein
VAARIPRDPETLERLLAQREAELLEARLLIEKLKLQILRAKRDKFGASSERLKQIEQLELLVEELKTERGRVASPAVPKPSDADVREGQDDQRRGGRKPLPDHLPRETQVHQPPDAQRCACAACGGRLRQIGPDMSEQLEYVPAHFKVVRHIRPKLACTQCHVISRLMRRAAPSRVAWRDRRCWPTSWCRSTATTSRCTARAASTHVMA